MARQLGVPSESLSKKELKILEDAEDVFLNNAMVLKDKDSGQHRQSPGPGSASSKVVEDGGLNNPQSQNSKEDHNTSLIGGLKGILGLGDKEEKEGAQSEPPFEEAAAAAAAAAATTAANTPPRPPPRLRPQHPLPLPSLPAAAADGQGGGGGLGGGLFSGWWKPAEEPTPLDQIPVRMDIRWSELEGARRFATGGMAHLYEARYRGARVVAKAPRADGLQPQHALRDLRTEVDVLRRLRHPHVVRFVGAGERPADELDGGGGGGGGPGRQGAAAAAAATVPFFLMEPLDGGNLTDHLGTSGAHAEGWEYWRRRARRRRLDQTGRLGLALELADALDYLQNRAIEGHMILHRDLKPDNVAIDANGSLKLFDFGLAKIVKKRRRTGLNLPTYELTGETGSLRYMAPEVAQQLPYNGAVDVYGWALLTWELMALRRPFHELKGVKDFFKQVVRGGLRPPLDPAWPEDFRELAAACWSPDPGRRPSAQELAALMKMLVRNALNEGERELRKGRGRGGRQAAALPKDACEAQHSESAASTNKESVSDTHLETTGIWSQMFGNKRSPRGDTDKDANVSDQTFEPKVSLQKERVQDSACKNDGGEKQASKKKGIFSFASVPAVEHSEDRQESESQLVVGDRKEEEECVDRVGGGGKQRSTINDYFQAKLQGSSPALDQQPGQETLTERDQAGEEARVDRTPKQSSTSLVDYFQGKLSKSSRPEQQQAPTASAEQNQDSELSPADGNAKHKQSFFEWSSSKAHKGGNSSGPPSAVNDLVVEATSLLKEVKLNHGDETKSAPVSTRSFAGFLKRSMSGPAIEETDKTTWAGLVDEMGDQRVEGQQPPPNLKVSAWAPEKKQKG